MQVEPEDPVPCPPASGFFFGRTSNGTDLNREEKAAVVEEIAAQIDDAEAIFAVDYRGISVPQAAELRVEAARGRRQLPRRQEPPDQAAPPSRPAATSSTSCSTGPTALTFVRGDTATAAKAIVDLQPRARRAHLQGRLHGRPRRSTRMASQSIARLPARRRPQRPARRRRRQPADRARPRPRAADRRPRRSSSAQIAEQGLVSGEARPRSSEAAAEETCRRGRAPRRPGRGGLPPRTTRAAEPPEEASSTLPRKLSPSERRIGRSDADEPQDEETSRIEEEEN